MTPQFHPNLMPVACRNIYDMKLLAVEMKKAALADVDLFPEGVDYTGSETVPQAIERAKEVVPDMIPSGKLRFIHYVPDRRLANVVLTAMERNGTRMWNLSMSHANPSGPQRVANDLSEMIVEAFLGNTAQEVEPKAVWKTVRHFVMEEKT